MFEHMMFRGTDRLGPTDHFDLLRRVGGTTNGYTNFDATVYHETLPADQIELALWLEAERMACLKIDQNAFDTERQVVEEERRLSVNGPYGTLVEKILAEAYHTHPYRWYVLGNIAPPASRQRARAPRILDTLLRPEQRDAGHRPARSSTGRPRPWPASTSLDPPLAGTREDHRPRARPRQPEVRHHQGGQRPRPTRRYRLPYRAAGTQG